MARILDPIDRASETIYGLIMALTFTGSLEVMRAGRAEVREMLIAAFGCNIAWGLVDGVMFVLAGVAQRTRRYTALQAMREATPADGPRLVLEALPEGARTVIPPEDAEGLWLKVKAAPMPPRPTVGVHDLKVAVAVFLVVFLSTFPIVIPFLVVRQPQLAIRLSNGVALVMLFILGAGLGRRTTGRWLRTGLAMVAIGALLVVMTIALGG